MGFSFLPVVQKFRSPVRTRRERISKPHSSRLRPGPADLNLGCPQRIAHSGHFGSYLLDPVDRPLVLDMVRTLAKGLTIPIFTLSKTKA